ncbi:hypothetical protein AND_007298 [Anopheles darlingi]|uniref:Uncharacterized protein n=1 Tax=Anopheles darlingi TaxID=43151 RepID=W5JDT9_ANODA|nr:hypothetical protein AND_007298 [Anopheles darlingi]
MAENSQWNRPSNEQLVRGLIGTLMSLSSTLLQAISDGDGGFTSERTLHQTLTPIHDQLRQLLESIHESEESQASTSVHGAARTSADGTTFRQQLGGRPTTAPSMARCNPITGAATSPRRHFSPRAASTMAKPVVPVSGNSALLPPGMNSGGSVIDSGHVTGHGTGGTLPASAAASTATFIVPSSWREISNAGELLAELQNEEDVDRASRMPRAWNNHERMPLPKDPQAQAAHRTVPAKDGVSGRTMVEQLARSLLLPPQPGQATFTVRETNNCALPDGTFQRTTKTIAGSDASVLTNYQQQQQHSTTSI